MKSFLFRALPSVEFFPQMRYPESTIRGHSTNGPIFGGGGWGEYDLCIANDADTNSDSYSNLGVSYRSNTPCDNTSLAGSKTFQLYEYEVYQVTRA